MATKTYFLQNIKKGILMLWNIYSKAGSKAKIVLRDNKDTYFKANKTSTDYRSMKEVVQGTASYKGRGANLRLEIELYDLPDLEIKQCAHSSNITDADLKTVGVKYTICIEDLKDGDYNDYYIDIVAWNK